MTEADTVVQTAESKKDQVEAPMPAQTTVDADLKAEVEEAADLKKPIKSTEKLAEYEEVAKVA